MVRRPDERRGAGLPGPGRTGRRPGHGRREWREIIPHRPGVRVEDVDAFSDVLVLSERADAETVGARRPARARGRSAGTETSWPRAGSCPPTESPSSSWLGANPEPEVTSLRFGRTSMVTPSSVLQIALDTRRETLLKQEPVLGDFDPGRYTTARLWAEAADGHAGADLPRAPEGTGTARPLPPLRVRRLRDLHRPGVLAITGSRCSTAGMVYAVAHVRGGGELGRAWYENGRMEHKANTFGDFIACASHLVAEGIARPDALAGRGGSAGGLLIGAVANTAPELFAALVAEVPFVDCLTTMLDADLPLTVGEWEEWGNPLADEDGLLPDPVLLALRQRDATRRATRLPAVSWSPPA